LDILQFDYGPGLWKLNNSLLLDTDVVDQIKSIFDSECNKGFKDGEGYSWWENLLALVVIYLKQHAKEMAFKRKTQEQELASKLELAIQKFQTNKSKELVEEITDIKYKLKELELYKMEGQRIRSRIFEVEKAEKPTKFFFIRAQAKKTRALIKKLNTTNSSVATGKALLEIVARYYKKLYEKKPTSKAAQNKLLGILEQKFNKSVKEELGKDITTDELLDVVKMLKKSKSPGSTGLTAEFFQECSFMLDGLQLVWKDVMKSGMVPSTFKKGVIKKGV
jgi:hypothetical protein